MQLISDTSTPILSKRDGSPTTKKTCMNNKGINAILYTLRKQYMYSIRAIICFGFLNFLITRYYKRRHY